uniref:Uncharacterized protein n=1 Tax=Setaria italica TaxID=4555 RepID=K4A2I1_SETIT
ASMDGHLILSAARRTVLNHGALLLSTHQGLNLLATMEQGNKKQQRGKLQRVLREQKARLYIIRRCVVMLLCWSD